jgi:co-chaperonin GroES (HSP10)
MSNSPSGFTLRPLPGKVVVKPDKPDTLSAGGIHLLGSADQTVGRILAVYQPFEDPMDGVETKSFLQVDDQVVFGKHSGVLLSFEREKFIILREAEILCVIESPQPTLVS